MKLESDASAPLAWLNGAAPESPQWFRDALDTPYESFSVEVDGATIDCRAWGDRGKPGLLFFHGNAAHLGWWSFLTPFFAAEHRVVALSFSGMGGSDWRPRYSIDHFVAEGMAAAEAGGAFLGGPPVLIGHSLGGLPVIRIAARMSERIRAGIIVDTAIPGPELTELPPRPSTRIYPDISSALSRFRLSPPQPCENPYIADYLARMGLKETEGGWTWRFDRALWGAIEQGDIWGDLAQARSPLAIIEGQSSRLTSGPMGKRMRSTAPQGTPFIAIAEACHHVMIDQPLALVASLRTLIAAGAWS